MTDTQKKIYTRETLINHLIDEQLRRAMHPHTDELDTGLQLLNKVKYYIDTTDRLANIGHKVQLDPKLTTQRLEKAKAAFEKAREMAKDKPLSPNLTQVTGGSGAPSAKETLADKVIFSSPGVQNKHDKTVDAMLNRVTIEIDTWNAELSKERSNQTGIAKA